MHPKLAKRPNGSLMIEALVSFTLMFTVSLVAMGLQAQSQRAGEKARNIATSTSIAREILEQAQMEPYDKLEFGESRQERIVKFSRGETRGATRFRATRVVSRGPSGGLKTITVEVTWNSGSVDLQGFVTE